MTTCPWRSWCGEVRNYHGYFALFRRRIRSSTEDYYSRDIILDDLNLLVNILDTAKEHFIRNIEGFLVIYSITDINSFNQVQMFVDRVLRVLELDYFPLVIVGTNVTLRQKEK